MQSGLPGSIETLLPPSPVHPLALYHAQMLEKRGYTYFKFDAVKTIYLANRDCLPPPLSAATWNEAFGAINRHDLKAIIKMLDLRRPIYKQTAAYGHFGRTDIDVPWEKTDKAADLKAKAGL